MERSRVRKKPKVANHRNIQQATQQHSAMKMRMNKIGAIITAASKKLNGAPSFP